ncbi:MAG: sensor histidine kinase [Chloroflexi bacterium]|nr:sensor histidine kinase [Chloroflexota bacterium]
MQTGTRYERNIFVFLSLYRFLTYGLAVVLIQVVSLDRGEVLSLQDYTLLTGVGVYTLLKVLAPLRWREQGGMVYVLLGGDLVVCLLALLLTGGLSSGFLLYSLTPVLTAALLSEELFALLLAGATMAALVMAHVLLSQFDVLQDEFVWIMESNYLLWLIVYSVSAFVMASMVYRTNLNIRRRIEVEAVAEERRRTRQELHDGVVQTMAYLNLKADLVSSFLTSQDMTKAQEGLNEIRKAAQEAYLEARETLDQLSIQIGVSELVPTLAEYLSAFGERNSIQTHFDAPEQPVRFSALAQLQVLRIIQEALTNIRKHAAATEVWVRLASARKGLELLVKDNGKGFETDATTQDGTGHYGLNILRERAESLGGRFTIDSAPGHGTEVRVSLPQGRAR